MVVGADFKAGSRPETPSAPNLSYDKSTGRLTVTWNRGSDAETPEADLTYELRIGTTPDGDDISRAHALPDGTRRNMRPGLCGYSTKMVFNTESWPEGNIYISLQTIDDTFLGSRFSDPAVFIKDKSASDFIYSVDKSFAVNHTVELALAANTYPSYSYTWDFGPDAVVVDKNTTMQTYTIKYTASGDKDITLIVENGNGIRSTTTKTINVEPVFVFNAGGGDVAFDLNGDGAHEVMDRSYNILAEDQDGNYVRLNKSWNAFKGSPLIADVNGDGMADIISNQSRLISLGDGDMELRNIQQPEWSMFDFNNDGKLDKSYNELNQGDYTAVTETGEVTSPAPNTVAWYSSEPRFYLDFNGDGLVDMGYIAGEPDPDNPLIPKKLGFHVFENLDGVRYRLMEIKDNIGTTPRVIDDLDSDGTLDHVFCDASYSFGVTSYVEFIAVLWGDGSGTTKYQCPDGLPFEKVIGCCDFNNDGMKDIAVTLQGGNTWILTLMPDRSGYTFTNAGRGNLYHHAIKKKDGSYSFGSLLQTEANERPTAPTALRYSQHDGFVILEWDRGTDKETPAPALRYNISLKKKGMSGEGAYLISPLNGGEDDNILPAPIYLNTAPRLTIPIASIPAGDYEIAVQSVDNYNEASPFSETLTFTVRDDAQIEVPTSVMVNTPVKVRISTNSPDIEVDFGQDAEVSGKIGKVTTVTWKSEGIHEIRMGGQIMASTMVYPEISAGFSFPQRVVKGASVTTGISRSEDEQWQISSDGKEFKPINEFATLKISEDGQTCFRFEKEGKYIIRHKVTRAYGEASEETTTEVYDADVRIDHADVRDNHYAVYYDPLSVPEDALAVRIYRETTRLDDYSPIGEVEPENGMFVDMASDPSVKAARYRLSYILPYGETIMSDAHQPVHVQCNISSGGGVNLLWNGYQGYDIDTYCVMKGSSPQSLRKFAEVSGHHTSFTDNNEDARKSWYAVMAVPQGIHGLSVTEKENADVYGISSNIVDGSEARAVILADSVAVTAIGGGCFDGRKSLQLHARILPVTATMNRVNWEIVEGSEIMSIDNLGVAVPSGFGKATVRATTQDGSGAYGEFEIENNLVPITFIDFDTDVHPENFTLEEGETFQYKIGEIAPDNANESPYWTTSDPSVATVDQNGLVTAVRVGSTDVKVSSPSNPEVYVLMALNVVRSSKYVPVSGISVEPSTVNGVVGDCIQLKATVHPENATDKTVVWDVEPYPYGEEQVIVGEITEDGLLTLTTPGSGWVTATSSSEPNICHIVSCFVSENISVTDIKVTPDEFSGIPGETVQLVATVYPEDAADKRVVWKMMKDNGVATVSDTGLLEILDEGQDTVEARSLSNPDVYIHIPIYGTSGIADILGDCRQADVYDIQGNLILKDATVEKIDKLEPGFYIINGTTILLTGK